MNRIRRKSSFWSLAGPLLGYWLIQMAVIVVVELVIAVPTMSDMLRELSSGSVSSQEEFAEFYVSAMETLLRQVMSYQAQITAAAALGTLIMTVILFRKDRQLEVTYNIPQWKKAPVSKYWPVAVMGIVGCIGVTCLSAMVQLVLYDPQYQDATAAVYSSSFPVELICLGIISPVAEEMMFRGVMFRRYRENRGFFYSALWSSVFFALMHTNMIQLVYSFLLGILLSYLYEKFGSVKAPVFLHILLEQRFGGVHGDRRVRLAGRRRGTDGGSGDCQRVYLFGDVRPDSENAGLGGSEPAGKAEKGAGRQSFRFYVSGLQING